MNVSLFETSLTTFFYEVLHDVPVFLPHFQRSGILLQILILGTKKSHMVQCQANTGDERTLGCFPKNILPRIQNETSCCLHVEFNLCFIFRFLFIFTKHWGYFIPWIYKNIIKALHFDFFIRWSWTLPMNEFAFIFSVESKKTQLLLSFCELPFSNVRFACIYIVM